MRGHSVRRWAALGGVLGPVTFIASWAVLGATRQGYSPVTDPISRLAAARLTPHQVLPSVAIGNPRRPCTPAPTRADRT